MNNDYEVVMFDVDKLIPYDRNPRTHSQESIDKMKGTIRRHGLRPPLLVKSNGLICDGHKRLPILLELCAEKADGFKTGKVPVILCDDWSEADIKAYRIESYQHAQDAWDDDFLKLELEELDDMDYPMDLLGFNDDELSDLFNDSTDNDNEGDSEVGDDNDDTYTKKITTPIYEPKNEKPIVTDLFDTEKTSVLIDEIEKSDIPQDEKQFLIESAKRHTVFNYQLIADYYAHSDEKVQDLMEKSALVIIDFKKAIENGYVKLSEEIAAQYLKEYPDE